MFRSLAPVWLGPALSLALGLASTAAAAAEVSVPPLERRVTDLTHTLGVSEIAVLERKLTDFERRKGSQIAVLILPTTEPETIEQYSIRVVERWKLGRKGVDDGALLLVAKDDRTLRIEVGYGLEGVLPDATANRLIDERIVPRFRVGDFSGGIDAGVDAMIAIVDGEPLPTAETWHPPVPGSNRLRRALMIALFIALIGGGVLRAIFGKLPAAAIVGVVVGVAAWVVLTSIAIALVFALIAFVVVLFGGTPATGRRYRHGGAWGGGGGGWSGGGGGFGGGGASGRW